MAQMRRFLRLQHSDPRDASNWGWVDALSAMSRLSSPPKAPSRFGAEKQKLLDGLYTFLKDCHGWLLKNTDCAPDLHTLIDSKDVLVKVCRMCTRYLHQLQQYGQDLEQMPEDGIACIAMVVRATDYVIRIAIMKPGCPGLACELPELTRAAHNTGLLDEVCRASLAVQATLQRHGGALKRCYGLPVVVLDVWSLVAAAWPGSLPPGNVIARSVPSISGLAAAVLDQIPSPAAATGTSTASNNGSADFHMASCSSSNSTRHGAETTSNSSREQQNDRQSQDTSPLDPTPAMMMRNAYEQDLPRPFDQHTRRSAVNVVLYLASGYIAAGSDPAIRHELERSSEFQKLLMIAFGVWVDKLHTQKVGRRPTLQVGDDLQTQQTQQQSIVPPHHQQLLLSCGLTREDMAACSARVDRVKIRVIGVAATRIVQLFARSGVAASSSSSSNTADASHVQQQQGDRVVALLNTLLEAAALLPTKSKLTLLPEVCTLWDELSDEQRQQASTGTFRTAIQLLLPMLQQLTGHESSNRSVGGSTSAAADYSTQERLAAACAAQHLLRIVYLMGDQDEQVAVYQRQPADWCAGAEAWVRSANNFQTGSHRGAAAFLQKFLARLIGLCFKLPAEDVPAAPAAAAAGAPADQQQQQQQDAGQLGLLYSLSKAAAVLLKSGAPEISHCLDLLQSLKRAMSQGMKCVNQSLQGKGLTTAADTTKAADWLHLQGRSLHMSGNALSCYAQQRPGQQRGGPTTVFALMIMPILCQFDDIYHALGIMNVLGGGIEAAGNAGTAAAAALAEATEQQLREHAQGLLAAYELATNRLDALLGSTNSSSSSANMPSHGREAALNEGQEIREAIKQLQDRLAPIVEHFQHQYDQLVPAAEPLQHQEFVLTLASILNGQLNLYIPEAAELVQQAMSLDLAHHLQQFGAAVCAALPVSCCCNNPGCLNLSTVSEQCLVSCRASVCSGCHKARYCGVNCQKQHWKAHKSVCKQIQKAEAAAAASLSG